MAAIVVFGVHNTIMLEEILSIGRKVTPKGLMPLGQIVAAKLIASAVRSKERNALPKILKYYEGRETTPEQREVLDYLRTTGFHLFPYTKLHLVKPEDIEVLHDKSLGLPYVMQDGRRLYYPENASLAEIRQNYEEHLASQHVDSPHRYLSDEFVVSEGEVVADCGTADGGFALSFVEKVRKLILFEPTERWERPLQATFAPWKDKVVLVKKFLSDKSDDLHVTLDEYFTGNQPLPTMLKMDVEGFEERVLIGGQRVLTAENGVRKVTVCTYHRQDDEQTLGNFLRTRGFAVTPSKGYMLFVYDNDVKPPYMRRGLIRALRP